MNQLSKSTAPLKATISVLAATALMSIQPSVWANPVSFATDYVAPGGGQYVGIGGSVSGLFDISSQLGSIQITGASITARLGDNSDAPIYQSTSYTAVPGWTTTTPFGGTDYHYVTDATNNYLDPAESANVVTALGTAAFVDDLANWYDNKIYLYSASHWINNNEYIDWNYNRFYGYNGYFDITFNLGAADLQQLQDFSTLGFNVNEVMGDLMFYSATLTVYGERPSVEGARIPEPGSMALVAVGLLGLAGSRRRRG